MNEINSTLLNSISGTSSIFKTSSVTEIQTEGSDFASTLSNALEQYESANTESDLGTLDLISGETDDISTVMIAAQKAELALNLTIQVRNKAIDAYKEIMNMQV